MWVSIIVIVIRPWLFIACLLWAVIVYLWESVLSKEKSNTDITNNAFPVQGSGAGSQAPVRHTEHHSCGSHRCHYDGGQSLSVYCGQSLSVFETLCMLPICGYVVARYTLPCLHRGRIQSTIYGVERIEGWRPQARLRLWEVH
jgi:hypothetical protein